MGEESDTPEHHKQRSEFIRSLVQCRQNSAIAYGHDKKPIPKVIAQYWHDLSKLPPDIGECVKSWARLERSGYGHRLFDEYDAKAFIGKRLGARHERAFERCYHPAMQADFFRLCYLLIEGGFYVDADDVCVSENIGRLFNDGRLKVQPLCYDITSGEMVKPAVFLCAGAYDPSWIFYFNNNPLVARSGHPIIEHALNRATTILELADENVLPEIQSTTGPGNISKSIFDIGAISGQVIERDLVVMRDWESLAVSRWPLVHREDSRNWRLCNQKRFKDR